MATYSIKDLENYTQIKAHTLRIWEQRYNILTPQRTDTNIRYYSEQDLKKLLNVNLLYTNGLKISKIAQLSEEAILEQVKTLIEKHHLDDRPEIDALIIAVMAMESEEIHHQLNNYFAKFGMEKMYEHIIVPVLIKIGKLWQVNALSIGHEHLFSNVLREFFITKIGSIETKNKSGKKVLLFLHENEEHELSLLFYHFLLKRAGFNCTYLGARVPLEDLKSSIDHVKPDLLVTNMIAKIEQSEIIDFFEKLSSFFDLSKVRVGGYQSHVYEHVIPKEVTLISSEKELIA